MSEIKIEITASHKFHHPPHDHIHDGLKCSWKAHDDLVAPLDLSENQRGTVIDAVAESVNLGCVDTRKVLAVVTFDSVDDTDPEIDYRVERADTEDVDVTFNDDEEDAEDDVDVTVNTDDDAVVIDTTDDGVQATLDELLEGSDIIDADA